MYNVENLTEVIRLAHECETPVQEFTLLVEKELSKIHPLRHEERNSADALGVRDLRDILPTGKYEGKLSVAVEQLEKTMTKREIAYAFVCSIAQVSKLSEHPLIKMIMSQQKPDGTESDD